MVYRIYIPALEPDGVSMTIDVEADNWMLALRYGLDEIGADRDLVKRAICDIKADKSIHVMEPAQGRVFVLREIEDTPPEPWGEELDPPPVSTDRTDGADPTAPESAEVLPRSTGNVANPEVLEAQPVPVLEAQPVPVLEAQPVPVLEVPPALSWDSPPPADAPKNEPGEALGERLGLSWDSPPPPRTLTPLISESAGAPTRETLPTQKAGFSPALLDHGPEEPAAPALTPDTNDVPTWAQGDVSWEPLPEEDSPIPRRMDSAGAYVEVPTVPEMPAVVDSISSTGSRPNTGEYPLNEADLEKYFDAPKAPRRAISHLDLARAIQGGPRVVGREPSTDLVAAVRSELAAEEGDNSQVLADVFEKMAEIDFVADTIEGTLQFALELSVGQIPSEAGWLLLADMNRRDLYFATATGPKAAEVFDYRLPMGKGIAGFCAVNGVSLSLSDVDKDPRFQSTISAQVGYHIDSVACAPIQHEGRVFGAIQIMNHRGRAEYTPGDLDVLNYIARRTAEYLFQHVEMT